MLRALRLGWRNNKRHHNLPGPKKMEKQLQGQHQLRLGPKIRARLLLLGLRLMILLPIKELLLRGFWLLLQKRHRKNESPKKRLKDKDLRSSNKRGFYRSNIKLNKLKNEEYKKKKSKRKDSSKLLMQHDSAKQCKRNNNNLWSGRKCKEDRRRKLQKAAKLRRVIRRHKRAPKTKRNNYIDFLRIVC